MKRLTTVALILVATALHAVEPSNVTTVILVRHAERESKETDSPLSAAGVSRAQELARVLADVNVTAIYSTPFKRTENTVAPLAANLGIKPMVLQNTKSYPTDVATAILEKHVGNTVVVVGHSNTTPETARALGVENVPAMPDSEYDDLWVVTIVAGSKPTLLKLRYGAVAR